MLRLACATVLWGLLTASAAEAAVYKVTRNDDSTSNGCRVRGCTLREAVGAARARPGADEVEVGSGFYGLSQGREEHPPIQLSGTLTIRGIGRPRPFLGGPQRVFLINGGKITLRRLRLSGRTEEGNGGAIATRGAGVLKLIDSRIDDSVADHGSGGGIYISNRFEALILTSQIDDNNADDGGGGSLYSEGDTEIVASELDDSHAARGGALFSRGRLEMIDTVVHDTHASDGGAGLYLANRRRPALIRRSSIFTTYTTGPGAPGAGVLADGARLRMVNATLAINRARGNGGGIAAMAGARVQLNGVTIAHEKAGFARGFGVGGGIFARHSSVTMRNTLVALNFHGRHVPDDCAGSVRSLGHNLFGNRCSLRRKEGDIRTRHPHVSWIGGLREFGGHTLVQSIRRASPAVDAGGPGCPLRDQRGFSRVGPCDIGAFEFGAHF